MAVLFERIVLRADNMDYRHRWGAHMVADFEIRIVYYDGTI
ncbi:MAG: hypothetical protein QF684_00595 [Candidatus Thalassarchaeaceae archaeon]|nr:hypothetical protein [Candidatus Thalassarchaeaceae archaeon]